MKLQFKLGEDDSQVIDNSDSYTEISILEEKIYYLVLNLYWVYK